MNMNQSKNIALSIHSLHKSYGKHEVLKGIDLDVYQGELFGFIGKNGVGKSTTIECSIGIKDFDSGTIEILGRDIRKESLEAKRCFGYVTSEPTAYEEMTGLSYVEFIASIYQVEEERFLANLRYLAKRLDLSDADLMRPIMEYSHGMKQKVCLIASLIHNPRIWILDEPTVGLDLVVNEMLFNLMKDLKANGRTIFLTSHNIDFVSKICDSVGILDRGRIKRHIDFAKEPMERRKLKDIFRSFDVEEEKE